MICFRLLENVELMLHACMQMAEVAQFLLIFWSARVCTLLPLYYLFCYSSLPFFFRALVSVLRPLRPHQLSAALYGDADEGEVKVI